MTEDPLTNLLLDAQQIDRALLADALIDILGIDKSSGQIVPKPGFNNLKAKKKVLAFLIGKKAAKLIGVTESESVPSIQLTTEVGIPDGTVRPKLRELLKERVISQDNSSDEYYIADFQIPIAISVLEGEEEHD